MSLDLSGIFKTEDSSLVEEEANPHVCDLIISSSSAVPKAALRDDDAVGCASVRGEFSTSRGWQRAGQ